MNRQHIREQAAHEAAFQPVETSSGYMMLMKMNKDRIAQLSIKFRNVQPLVKHYRLFTDYNWMHDLDRLKGLEVGAEYTSEKAAATFAVVEPLTLYIVKPASLFDH